MNGPATPSAATPPLTWRELRGRLDETRAFNMMRDTPYYRDAVYPQFSAAEYARRYGALRAKMAAAGLDAVIVPGGPSHWSFGGGMLWLTGHWEWHSLACYVLVPAEGAPTLITSMGGTHAEAVRREVAAALSDVRSSRNGQYAEVIADRLEELGLQAGRIGMMEIDARHGDYMPVNQYDTLRRRLPQATLVFTKGWLHALLSVHSAEELDCVRRAGELCQAAMEALIARARPGATEYQLRAAAAAAILDGGGEIDFLIIGSTPMADPAMVFGNPHPSARVLQDGDLVLMELAAGYRGYSAQIGSPVCIGPPTEAVRRFWEDVAKPGYLAMVAAMGPGRPVSDIQQAGRCFRAAGAQSRPIHFHGIDLITDGPHVFCDHIGAEPFEQILRPGMVVMPEPNPITADGLLGLFVGHTYIITESGAECVDRYPIDLVATHG